MEKKGPNTLFGMCSVSGSKAFLLRVGQTATIYWKFGKWYAELTAFTALEVEYRHLYNWIGFRIRYHYCHDHVR